MGISNRQHPQDKDPDWEEPIDEMILECDRELVEEQLENDDIPICVLRLVLATKEVKKFDNQKRSRIFQTRVSAVDNFVPLLLMEVLAPLSCMMRHSRS